MSHFEKKNIKIFTKFSYFVELLEALQLKRVYIELDRWNNDIHLDTQLFAEKHLK